MLHVNKMDLFNFLILVSLFCGIRGEFGGVKEQKKIAFGRQLGNNFDGTSGEATITPAITVDDENFDDNELKKLFIQNFQKYYNLSRKNKDLIPLRSDDFSRSVKLARKGRKIASRNEEFVQLNRTNNYTTGDRRKVRHVRGTEEPTYNLKCYECDGSLGSHEEKACYDATMKNVRQCKEAAQCYIELNPQYIRRGCLLPNQMNRTFACRCPLCNSNPSWDNSFYMYQNMRDWQFDNLILQSPIQDISLLCKYCNTETDEYNNASFHRCRSGVDAPFTACKRNTVCYTNINDELGHVSRGCISLPVYNSIYFFCNGSLCNAEKFQDPITRRSLEHPIVTRLYHNNKLSRNVDLVSQKKSSFSDCWRNSLNFWTLFVSVLFTFLNLFQNKW